MPCDTPFLRYFFDGRVRCCAPQGALGSSTPGHRDITSQLKETRLGVASPLSSSGSNGVLGSPISARGSGIFLSLLGSIVTPVSSARMASPRYVQKALITR